MGNDTEMTSENRTVDEWNDELVKALLADTICLAIYLVIGVIGNSVVLCVYCKRTCLNNEDRFFIPILAIIDLVACIVNCSFSISINMLPVKYNSDFACKFMWFLAMHTTGTSAFTLMLISIHRYLKLCKPFGRQMTHKWKKVYLSVIISGMVLVALPCFAFYGSAEVKWSGTDISGFRCTSVPAGLPKVALVYKAILFLLFLGNLIVLVVLYSLIGRVLYKQARFSWKLNFTKEATSATSATSDSSTLGTDSDGEKTANPVTGHVQEAPKENDPHTQCTENARSTVSDVKLQKHKSPSYRVTVIFMIIAGVYILCFIPKLAMLVWESRKTDFWLNLTPSELGGYRFLYTFFIVNNIVNPFIYGFLDKKFQTEFKKIICRKT